MRPSIPAFPVALALALAAATPVKAQNDPAQNDPKYEAAVARMAETIRALPSYAVDVRLDWKAGDGVAGANLLSFRLQRPGKFRVETRADGKAEPSLVVVSDGTTVTTYLPDKKLYDRDPFRGLDHLLEDAPILAAGLKGSLIDTLMRPDMKAYVLARSHAARPVGTETVDGRALTHFHLTWGRDGEDFWLGPDDQTLPRKLVRTYVFPGKDEAALKLTTTATLSWAVDKPIDPKSFAVDLPADAKEVEDLEAALTGGTAETILGMPVPSLALPKVGGGEVKLDDVKGKGAVALIFWASWSAACVEGVPALAALQGGFKDKGVTFLAVNAGEEAPAAAAFLKKHPLPFDALMDPDGEAVERFGVTDLPTVVLVDKAGLVRAVHSGAGATLVKAVRDDLDALAAGRSPRVKVPQP